MRYFKLTIAYDGTDFHGWQTQANKPTIQGEIVGVLRRLTQENVVLHAAGRTDAGVHALGQVGSFRTQSPLSAQEFQRALNALLPPAIRIAGAEEVGPDFNARWSARGFVGTHDFASFAASTGSEEDDKERSNEREIFATELVRSADNEELVFTIRGRSFLRYMVRKMVGTLLDVGRGKLTPADIDRLYELRDRSKSGPTVPPQGLVMVEVQHEEAWRLGQP